MDLEEKLKKYKDWNIKWPNRKVRQFLFKKDPHCIYCGIETKEYEEWYVSQQKGFKIPDDLATLEHLYDKLDPKKRYEIYPDHSDKAIACHRCNQRRGKERVNAIPERERLLRYGVDKQYKEEGGRRPRPVIMQERLKTTKVRFVECSNCGKEVLATVTMYTTRGGERRELIKKADHTCRKKSLTNS